MGDLLLDTNALLWWLLQSSRMSQRAYAAITDPQTRVYVSLVSAWEIAIKVTLGKLPVPPHLATWLPAKLQAERFATLPITLEHVLVAAAGVVPGRADLDLLVHQRRVGVEHECAELLADLEHDVLGVRPVLVFLAHLRATAC